MGTRRNTEPTPRSGRLVAGRVVGAFLIAGLLTVGVALPAAALPAVTGGPAPDPAAVQPLDLLLSTDGVTYAETLTGGLFDGAGALVPQRSVSADLWVKNPSESAASFRLSAREVTVSDDAFAQSLTLTTWESVSDNVQQIGLTELTPLESANATARCGIVVPERPVPAGQVVHLRMTVAMNDAAAPGVNQWLNLNFRAAMRDAGGGAFALSACNDQGVLVPSAPAAPRPSAQRPSAPQLSWLASTGVDGLILVLSLAALSLGVGAAMSRRTRAR